MKRYTTFVILLSIGLFYFFSMFFSMPCEAQGCVKLLKIEKAPKGKRTVMFPLEHIKAIIADVEVTDGVGEVELTDSFGQVLSRLGKIRKSGITWKAKIKDSKTMMVKLSKDEYATVMKALADNPSLPGLRIQVSMLIKKMSKDQVYLKKTKYDENRTLLKSCDITSVEAPELSTKLDSPIKATPGEALGDKISVSVENTGTAAAKNVTVQLVLSETVDIPIKEAEYSANYKANVLLEGGKTEIPLLEPGKSLKVELKGPFKIPADTPPGKYYLGSVIDPGGKIEEMNEKNNRDARFVNIEVPVPVKMTLEMPDTYLVYTPANFGLNVVSHEAIISDGKDWRKCMIRPFLHQLKHVAWSDFFLEVDTSDRSVWQIKKAKFCKKGGKAKELKLKPVVTGGSKTKPPTRIVLKLPNTRLEFEPKGRKLRIIAENFHIAYVSFWRVFQLKPHIFRFQHTLWPDFFWEVNTFKKTVEKITGTQLGKAGGTGAPLEIKLTVN